MKDSSPRGLKFDTCALGGVPREDLVCTDNTIFLTWPWKSLGSSWPNQKKGLQTDGGLRISAFVDPATQIQMRESCRDGWQQVVQLRFLYLGGGAECQRELSLWRCPN